MTGNLVESVDHTGLRVTGGERRRSVGTSAPIAAMELCRLTILARSVQVDMALPTDVPIALMIPGIVDLAGNRAARGEAADTESRRPAAWVLSRVGQPPLEATQTLSDAVVRDGELLVLGDAESPAPPPLFDDLMHAVAMSGATESRLWTPRTARSVGFGIAAVALLITCFGLLREPLSRGPGYTPDIFLAIAAAFVGLMFLVAGSIVGRAYSDERTGIFLSGCALPLVFSSGVLFVPGALGGAHLMLGSAVAGAVAVLALRLGGHGGALFTGIAALSGIAVAASAVMLFGSLSPSAVGAGATAVALLGLAAAPRMSMMQARMPLPPVPTAGASLDGEGETDSNSFQDLEDVSRTARSYLTGFVCACSAAATVGAFCAAFSGHPISEIYWPGVVLALLTALVLVLRGRTFAELDHAVPVVAAGSIIVLAVSTTWVFAIPDRPIIPFAAAIGVTVIALVFGSFVPQREYSPVLRRAGELVEYAAIAAIVPIVCWVCGLYAAMRGL
ncbi:type VII secretion integral membrane protein EccD [Rhodococcus sp. 1163]|uniref:type VII secretion integral membrane protein EccD n=1 Tax=Rhodococcus sp. 1163 TaxID=1905289 RepID=UPI000A0529E9|nr:type VII secretion integral membrane protein EccD [Rhodococcus sp. 1163]